MRNTYTLPCLFFGRVQKCNSYLCIKTLTYKNISGILLVVSLSLNMFYLSFSRALTWKYINYICLVSLYTLNTQSTPCFFVYNYEKPNSDLSCYLLAFKTSIESLFSYFQAYKYVSHYLVLCLYAFKYVISAGFCSFPCNCISSTYFVAF